VSARAPCAFNSMSILIATFSVARGEKEVKDLDAVDTDLRDHPAAAGAAVRLEPQPLKPIDSPSRLSRLPSAAQGEKRRPTSVKSSPESVFEEKLRRIVAPGDHVLDAGCGTGKFFGMEFARKIGCRLVGIDVRKNLSVNSEIDFALRAELNRLPFSDGSFDVVNCRLVIEHVDFPDAVLKEFYRVLKPGGRLAIFTPNLLHYFGAAASLTPHRFHVWFNSRVRGFSDEDIFPTRYRANTRRELRKLFLKSGFSSADISLVEGAPSVLAFNSLLHRMGLVYERLVNRYDFLSSFRLNIIAVAYKN
jgi:ubiquinone/menaquinone biosynthesis C-methylase UbiE